VTPGFADTHDMIRVMWCAHYAGAWGPYLPKWREKMDPAFVACIEDGMKVSVVDYIDARGKKLIHWDSVRPLFEKYDLLLTPSVSVPALPLGRINPEGWPQHPWDWLGWASFSYPFNFTGQPACSIPAGLTKAGLPVGLQIVGRRFRRSHRAPGCGRLREGAALAEEAPRARLSGPVRPAETEGGTQ